MLAVGYEIWFEALCVGHRKSKGFLARKYRMSAAGGKLWCLIVYARCPLSRGLNLPGKVVHAFFTHFCGVLKVSKLSDGEGCSGCQRSGFGK